jgi:hypothetical protein
MVERVYRKSQVRELYGNPPMSTFHNRMAAGHIPRPDVMLSDRCPGWTQTCIEQHQRSRVNAYEPISIGKKKRKLGRSQVGA